MVHKLTCIRCPIGCQVVIEKYEDRYSLSGNECVIGVEYAINEIKDPKRILTTTVFVQNGKKPLRNLLSIIKTKRYLQIYSQKTKIKLK